MECNHGDGSKFEMSIGPLPEATRWAKNEIRALEVTLAKHKQSLAMLVVTSSSAHEVLMRESIKNLLVSHPAVGNELVAQLREFAAHLEEEIKKGGHSDAEVHGRDEED